MPKMFRQVNDLLDMLDMKKSYHVFSYIFHRSGTYLPNTLSFKKPSMALL